MKYVIIGNGGAGISALETIRQVDKDSEICIISREKYPAYSPCSLPDLLGGDIEESQIFRFDDGFYDRLNASFRSNSEAVRIDPKKRIVKLSDGRIVKFDKLLIAAGAKPITPKGVIELDLEGVHVMGTLGSTLGIIDQLKKGVDHTVVVGGGFMGIETGVMLKKRGVDITIVELLPHVLQRMLDVDISTVVEKILLEHGIDLVLNDAVKKINGEKSVESVSLGDLMIPCDMVIMAIGVSPNIDLVKGSGIKTNRGILVSPTMQTNKEGIYATGDIAEVREQISGNLGSYAIWPNAIEQGRIAGLNMTGIHTEYHGADVINILDVFGTPVVAIGGTNDSIGDCEELVRETPQTYKKLLLRDNRILGLQFVGGIRNTGPFYALMKRGEDISRIKDRLLDENFVVSPASSTPSFVLRPPPHPPSNKYMAE